MKITGREVLAYVAKFYDMPVDVLTGPTRRRPYARARQVAMYVMRQICPHLSYPAIGGIIGGRDHTTILHGVAKIEQLVEDDAEMADDINLLMAHFEPLVSERARAELDLRIDSVERLLSELQAQRDHLSRMAA